MSEPYLLGNIFVVILDINSIISGFIFLFLSAY